MSQKDQEPKVKEPLGLVCAFSYTYPWFTSEGCQWHHQVMLLSSASSFRQEKPLHMYNRVMLTCVHIQQCPQPISLTQPYTNHYVFSISQFLCLWHSSPGISVWPHTRACNLFKNNNISNICTKIDKINMFIKIGKYNMDEMMITNTSGGKMPNITKTNTFTPSQCTNRVHDCYGGWWVNNMTKPDQTWLKIILLNYFGKNYLNKEGVTIVSALIEQNWFIIHGYNAVIGIMIKILYMKYLTWTQNIWTYPGKHAKGKQFSIEPREGAQLPMEGK